MATITYPDGRTVSATRNPDGTYSPKQTSSSTSAHESAHRVSSYGSSTSSRSTSSTSAHESAHRVGTSSTPSSAQAQPTSPEVMQQKQAELRKATSSTLSSKVASGTATPQERAMLKSVTAFDRYGNTAQPYYTDAGGRKWTESQLAFVNPGEATALRYAAATGSSRPKITTYGFEQKQPTLDPSSAIMLPYKGTHTPVKSSDQLKRLGTAVTAAGVLSRSTAQDANRLTERINQEYEAFNNKWGGSGELDESQMYAYTMERQDLSKRTDPLITERNRLISSSDIWGAKSADYYNQYEQGKEEYIPILAKETARKMEAESIYQSRKLATTPSTPGEVLTTTARGVASGAGYGLVAGGLGFAPLTPATVALGAASGGVAGVGYEAGKTATVFGFQQIPGGSEAERKYLMTKPIPKLSAQKGIGFQRILNWLEAAPKSPTLEQYVEAELRGEDTYKDYELFNPQLAVQGAQVGAGLVGSVASIEAGAKIATYGTPKVMALRNNLIGKAKLEGAFQYEKNTKLITGETQADVSLETAKGQPVGNAERFSVGRGERVKIYGDTGDKGFVASKSDITIYKSGKTPGFESQYDLTRYQVVGKQGATTDIYTQGASFGGGKPRVSELGLRITESTPGNYMVNAQGKIIPASPLEPKIDVEGMFTFKGVTETKVLTPGGDPIKMIPPSGSAKTPWDYGSQLPKFDPGFAFKGSVGSGTTISSGGGSSGGGFTQLSPYTQSRIIEEVSVALMNPPSTTYSNVPPGAVLPPGIVTTTESVGALSGISYPITRPPLAPPGGGKKIKRPGGKVKQSIRPEIQTISASLPVITGIESPTEKALTSRVNVVPAVGLSKVPGIAPTQTIKPSQITEPVVIPSQVIKPITVTETIAEPAPAELLTPITPGLTDPRIPPYKPPPIVLPAPNIPLGIWREGRGGGTGRTKPRSPTYAPSVTASVYNIFTSKKQKASGWSGFETRPIVVSKTITKTKSKKKKTKKNEDLLFGSFKFKGFKL